MPAVAAAERVGVVVAVTVNTRAREAQRLADALGAALLDQLDIDVVAGREAERRLPPEGVPDTCVVDSACQQDVARRLEADQLLLLAVVRVGKRVQIDATWVHVATGRTASRPRILLQDGQSTKDVLADAVFELMPDAALRMGSGRRRAGEPTAPGASLPAAELVRPAPQPRRMTAGAWIAGGIGVGALAASGMFALDATRRYRDLDAGGCADMACSISDIDAVDSRALVTDVLLGVGVAAGITAVVLYWRSGAPASEQTVGLRRPRLDVAATAGGMAITWGGWF